MSDTMTQTEDYAIAVIGMAGRFPGAPSIEELWHKLHDGEELVRFFSDEELVAAGVEPELCSDPNYVKAKALLGNTDLFDAEFFGYTPKEAELMDPQQRVFLECAWEAMESAGYGPFSCDSPVGVFAGQAINTYRMSNAFAAASRSRSGLDVLISSDKDFLTTRVSYKLNLKGPSIVVQTACSTSLVAICEACKSLVSEYTNVQ